MDQERNPNKNAELSMEQNYNQIDGIINNLPVPPPEEKPLDKVREHPPKRRSVPIYVWVRPDELEVIRERMAEAGIRNMSAYIRKMALGGYVLHVDLEPVKELVSLQRRCANNLNQAAIHANSYGGLYPDELKRLQKDYADLWGPLSDLLAQLSAIVTM